MFKTIITGHISQDATVRETNTGYCAIAFSVAHTNKWKNAQGVQQEKTIWVNCTLWRKNDKRGVADYLRKGTKILVEGECSARAWIAPSDNTAKSSLEIRVDNFEFLSKAPEQNQQSTTLPTNTATTATTENIYTASSSDNDDLPF